MANLQSTPSGIRWRKWFFILLALILIPVASLAIYLWSRFGQDVPVDYANIEEQFKYGSTGGEHEMGFPYWIWQALPQVCSKYLPGKGYASLGFTYEKDANGQDKDLPVGVSKRRYQGIDRVFLNCAACHASTVRKSSDSAPVVIAAMPANTFNIMAFEKFFFNCGKDPKFSADWVIGEIDRQGANIDLLDRWVVYPIAIALMRDRVIALGGRFNWVYSQNDWGAGRVDTFNSAKVLFNFPFDKMPATEMNAPSDFPSIWNQRKKRGMQLHWDGNNNMTEERNKNAAFGTGTTPPTIDLPRIARIETWLLDAQPPAFSKYFPIDPALSTKGAVVYQEHCAGCHGTNGQDFGFPAKEPECVKPGDDTAIYGASVGKVTLLQDIGTDRRRLDSFSPELLANLGTTYAGYPWRFCHFRKTFGYANMPLDGLWLRAPYLHNGSVPSLRDLLEPSTKRPKVFYRGDDLYDPAKLGFVSNVAEEGSKKYFKFDVTVEGNSNAGHEGKYYGTELPDQDKAALVEYLKTF